MNTMVKTLGLMVVSGLLSALVLTGCDKSDTEAAATASGGGPVTAAQTATPPQAPPADAAPADPPPADPTTVAPKPYPLTTCLVTGEELGSMGDPIIRVYDGQEIRFCCKGCIAKFEADKEKYLAMLPASE